MSGIKEARDQEQNVAKENGIVGMEYRKTHYVLVLGGKGIFCGNI